MPSASEDINPSFQAKGSRTPIEPKEIVHLRKGDHIGWHSRSGLYWHHAIVCDTKPNEELIEVIHFNKKTTFEIRKELLSIFKYKGDCFRFDYSEDIEKNNPPDTVLKRANDEVEKSGYHPWNNNCEHFATYCKTGKKDCHQVHWAKGKFREGAEGLAANGVKSVVRGSCIAARKWVEQSSKDIAEASSQVLRSSRILASAVAEKMVERRSIVKEMVENGPKSVAGRKCLENVATATDWIGAGVVVIFEAVNCCYDVYEMHKNKRVGKIADKDFKISTTQRVTEGVLGSGLAIGGSVLVECLGGRLGTFICPGIGTGIGDAIGSVIGGVCGTALGKATGVLFGNLLGRALFG